MRLDVVQYNHGLAKYSDKEGKEAVTDGNGWYFFYHHPERPVLHTCYLQGSMWYLIKQGIRCNFCKSYPNPKLKTLIKLNPFDAK